MNAEPYLFDLSTLPCNDIQKRFKSTETPIWTRNKAQFIARYLKTFTFVTKHGTYIDAFAGPQHEETSEISWAAKLVMENEPAWLRNFYLFEKDSQQVEHLQTLKDQYMARNADIKNRRVFITQGDCNEALPEFLKANPIKEKEASFCLLDQRSTECNWETVRTVAKHKGFNGGNKIELFYFLAQGWIDRAIKSWRKDVEDRCKRWWGNDSVRQYLSLGSYDRGQVMAKRFKDEFGYAYAYPFPIQKAGVQGRVMFWMVHASDHQRAPELMWQAYKHIGAGGGVSDPLEQIEFDVIRETSNCNGSTTGHQKS